jgi:hypothetical protein
VYSHLDSPFVITSVAPPTFGLSGPTAGTFTGGHIVTIQWLATNVDVAGPSKISLAYDPDATPFDSNAHWIAVDRATVANGAASHLEYHGRRLRDVLPERLHVRLLVEPGGVLPPRYVDRHHLTQSGEPFWSWASACCTLLRLRRTALRTGATRARRNATAGPSATRSTGCRQGARLTRPGRRSKRLPSLRGGRNIGRRFIAQEVPHLCPPGPSFSLLELVFPASLRLLDL